jgi:hypothetical protein
MQEAAKTALEHGVGAAPAAEAMHVRAASHLTRSVVSPTVNERRTRFDYSGFVLKAPGYLRPGGDGPLPAWNLLDFVEIH